MSHTLTDDLFEEDKPLDKDQLLSDIRAPHKRSALGWTIIAVLLLLFLIGGIWAKSSIDAKVSHLQSTARSSQTKASVQDTKLSQLQTSTSQLVQDNLKFRKELKRKGVNPNTIAPPPEVRLVPGPTPGPGADGRGIRTASISDTGRFILFYTDGTNQVIGNVQGAKGATGLGIKAASIIDSHLIIQFTDGDVSDLGTVVGDKGDKGEQGVQGIQGVPGVDGKPGDTGATGDPGRGIKSSECVGSGSSSHWEITYTDDTTSESDGPCRVDVLP